MPDTIFTNWKKSSYSSGDDNCVEVAIADDGTVGLRDSKNRDAGILAIDGASWTAFVAGVRDGEFDR
jgi:hypothetical protein